ncbi:MAG: PEGA domain-containing protein [Anaeromyxobacteraceae bacterium]
MSAPAPTPAPPAASEPAAALPALAVIPLHASSELALLGRSLSEAIAQEAAKIPGSRVISPSEVVAKLGADAALQASRCGEAPACHTGPGKQLGADRAVGGRIDRAGASYRFGLVLVDVKSGSALARVVREVPIASRRIRADVIAAAGPLLRGEAAGTGVLAVLTEAPGAEVRVDEKPAGKTPLEARLPAGKHRVEVAQRGKVVVEPFWVDVPANGRAEQRVRLYDIPVAQRRPGVVETTTVEMGKPKKVKQ